MVSMVSGAPAFQATAARVFMEWLRLREFRLSPFVPAKAGTQC